MSDHLVRRAAVSCLTTHAGHPKDLIPVAPDCAPLSLRYEIETGTADRLHGALRLIQITENHEPYIGAPLSGHEQFNWRPH